MDLNADVGEGYGSWPMGDDAGLMEVVTSASIACGFHAGDPGIMRRCLELAVANGVAVGAHVSYPDLRGFGRHEMRLPPRQICDDVLYQIGALDALARAAGGRVSYVKAHGALYNRSADDPEAAGALAEAVRGYDSRLCLLTMPGSAASQAAQAAGLRAVAEGYADRAYRPDGRLMPRGSPGAVVDDLPAVVARAGDLALRREVAAGDGTRIELTVESLCVHGDTPGAVELARSVREALSRWGVPVAPFSG
ncbi:MAG: LamB/YcsF family protein [Acidimicrobiales bacterium]